MPLQLTRLNKPSSTLRANKPFLTIVGTQMSVQQRLLWRPVLTSFEGAFMNVAFVDPSVSRQVAAVFSAKRTLAALELFFISVNSLQQVAPS